MGGVLISLMHSVEDMRIWDRQGCQGASQISHAVPCDSTLRVGLQTHQQICRRNLMGLRPSLRVVQGSVGGEMHRKEVEVVRSKEEARRLLCVHCFSPKMSCIGRLLNTKIPCFNIYRHAMLYFVSSEPYLLVEEQYRECFRYVQRCIH